jgi:hypothetical protein
LGEPQELISQTPTRNKVRDASTVVMQVLSRCKCYFDFQLSCILVMLLQDVVSLFIIINTSYVVTGCVKQLL